MGQQERLRFSVWISVLEQRGHRWTGVLPPFALFLGTLADVPELHVHLVPERQNQPRKHKKKPNLFDFCGWKLCKEGHDDTMIDQEMSKVGGCLIIDAKGVFDAIHRSKSAALSMQDKRSAVEYLALREAIGRTKTLLRWCHSEANVADALTKVDNRAHELLRKFLHFRVWRIVWDPDFTSCKKLKQQKKVKQSRTS